MECDECVWSNNHLGFDFDFDFYNDDTGITFSVDQTSSVGSSARECEVFKASRNKMGSKCVPTSTVTTRTERRTKKTKSKFQKERARLTIDKVELDITAKPLLYVFPSFDKSDSLIYLPSTLSRHMNSGDSEATARLMLSHLDRNCIIDIKHQPCGLLNPRSFVRMLDLITDLHPDSILCAVQTKVEGNLISATFFAKFTDNKLVYESVRSSLRDPALRTLFGLPREQQVRRSLEHAPRNEEESQQIITLADSDLDLLVYAHIDFSMTVDDITKKVSKLYVHSRMTSMHPILDKAISN